MNFATHVHSAKSLAFERAKLMAQNFYRLDSNAPTAVFSRAVSDGGSSWRVATDLPRFACSAQSRNDPQAESLNGCPAQFSRASVAPLGGGHTEGGRTQRTGGGKWGGVS